ncbi:MAG: hypothetical protein M0Z85_11490 [Gammaproteobacteria bacterium]|nr:hypothetical protein [Gammaproteobacteria bacterium]
MLLAFLLVMGIGGPLAISAFGKPAAILMMFGFTVAFAVIVVTKGEPLSQKSDDDQQIARGTIMRLRYYKISSYFVSALLILLSVPLALKWVPKNAIYGFRVASSLTGTTAHWYYVNQVAGIAGISAGCLSILFAVFVADHLRISEVARGRAAIMVTLLLAVAAAFSPYVVR